MAFLWKGDPIDTWGQALLASLLSPTEHPPSNPPETLLLGRDGGDSKDQGRVWVLRDFGSCVPELVCTNLHWKHALICLQWGRFQGIFMEKKSIF